MFMKQRVKQLAITEKSVKKKKIVAVVIIMFIFSIIILGVGSKLVFQKICERRETAWPDLGTADDEQYEWLTEAYKIKQKNNEKIVILASDGTKLEGHYYERKKNAPLVIFFHGFRGHSYVDGVPIYKIAQKEKWNVLLVSMRAHDESEGNIFTLGVKERYDCVDWANWAAKHFGRETPIFLMGISMGGAVVTMSSNLDFPDSVCGIIEDSGFTTSTKMLELNCKSSLPKGMPVEVFKIFADVGIKLWGGFNLKEADACKAVSQTKIPILIIHGDMDNLAPLYMAKEIYNSCKSSKEIYIVHGAGHAENYKKDPEGYEKIITTFIKERVHKRKRLIFRYDGKIPDYFSVAGASTKRVWPVPNPDGTHRIDRCENVKDVGQYIARIDEMIERKQRLFEEK